MGDDVTTMSQTMDPRAEQLDNMLLQFAQQCGGIQEILHQFFAFLARRTDFYYIQDANNTTTGFPEGIAEQMLLKHFHHFQELANQKFQAASAAGTLPKQQRENPEKAELQKIDEPV